MPSQSIWHPAAYPWLTITETDDGPGMSGDMEGTSPAEMDRRLIIMQEIKAGRLMLPEAPVLDEDSVICCDHVTQAKPSCENGGDGLVTLGELVDSYSNP